MLGFGKSGVVMDLDGMLRCRETRYGKMFYMPHDHYIGKALDIYGEFSELESIVFKLLLRPGMTALDVGANIGVHTVHMAQLLQTASGAGRLIAFEPQRAIYYILVANLLLNGLIAVEAQHAGVGAVPGIMSVPPMDYNKPFNFGGVSLVPHGEDPVRIVHIDSLDLAACHFIKVDVEGMEREVITGAARTIRRCRPFMYVENDRRQKSPALLEELMAFDYDIYWHLPSLYNPANHMGNQQNIYARTVSCNVLCVPKELHGKANVTGLRKVQTVHEWLIA